MVTFQRRTIFKLVCAISILVLSFHVTASALPPIHKEAIDKNAPHFFKGSGTGDTCSTASGVTLEGGTNAEMVWNFFVQKDLKPVAIAGIMGNFDEEAGAEFDPAVKQNYTTRAIPDSGDGKTGFGLAQWTSADRQAKLFTEMEKAGLGKYHGEGWGNPEVDKTEMKAEDVEKLIGVELTFAWEQDSSQIKSFADKLNAATSVDGNSGSTMIFHSGFERSGDDASQLRERIDAAKLYLKKFGGIDSDTSSGSSGCSQSGGELGGVEAPEDAIAWALKFVDDTKAQYPNAPEAKATVFAKPEVSSGITTVASWPESSSFVCWGAYGCDECTTLSGWFVTNMTSYTYGGGNGGEVVDNLATKGVPTGSQPKPFSIFSYDTGSFGHTGLVLGVQSDGTVITIENNWPSNKLSVRQYNIKKEYPAAKFAYVADKMNDKVGGIGDD